jgi:glycyl-tRNA synthetase
MKDNTLMEKVVSLAKRRGFVYPGSEIYGGLAGMWDYGPLGVALKNNVRDLWWRMFVAEREDVYGIDAATIMNPRVWEASGHVAEFADRLGDGEMFNTMFKTHVGAGEEALNTYLRPETAGGIFVNFKNIVDSFHPVLPFGIAQIGKAFRNEIAPRDFLFRAREFEQMEIEYFIRENDWERAFEEWRGEMRKFIEAVGIEDARVHEVEVPNNERAHYSKRTIDFEFDFPFGRKELYGLAYRGNFDLSVHQQASGVDLRMDDFEEAEVRTDLRVVPHVVEPSFGMERTIFAILVSAYREDELGGERRVFLKLKPAVAPVKIAVFPLLRNKPELVKKAREVYNMLKRPDPTSNLQLPTSAAWDDNGNIGKRYRRQDEIGTPFCVTVDFDTLKDDTVTVRDRDTGEQERVAASELPDYLKKALISLPVLRKRAGNL